MKAFNKGDLVTYIESWDGKGSVTYRHAVVYSRGKKQMVLTDAETGEEMGRQFRPENAIEIVPRFAEAGRTYCRRTDDEAVELAKEIGAKIVADQMSFYNGRIDREDRCEYFRKQIAMLHEPEGLSYTDALARLEKKLGAEK